MEPSLITDENAKLAPSLDERGVSSPAARKNRLAALAQNINTWEDDLSHVTPK